MKIRLQIIFCLIFSYSFGQNQFQKTFSFGNRSFGQNVIQSMDHGWILTGYTEFNSDEDCFILKTNGNGDTLWTVFFGDTADNRGFGLIENADSSVSIAGNNYYTWVGDIFLCRLNYNGDTIWQRTFHEDSVMLRYPDICKADSGAIMIYCGTFDKRDLSSKSEVIKVDSLGNVVWSKSFGVNASDGSWYKIIPTLDGNFVIVSNALVDSLGRSSLIKFDATGSVVWSKCYKFGYENSFGAISQTQDEGFILGGLVTRDTIHFESSLFLLKTDSSGNVEWSKSYNGSVGRHFPFVKEIPDTGYVFMAALADFSNEIALIKTDTIGDTLTTSLFPGGNLLLFHSACANFDRTYTIHSSKFNGSIWDAYMIKTDEYLNTGCGEFQVLMTISSDTITDSVFVPSMNATPVNITPHQYNFGRGCSVNIICAPVGLTDILENDYKIYPNPGDNFLRIESQFQLSKLFIYNYVGELTLNLDLSGKKEIDISNLPVGMYVLKIFDQRGFVLIKKFIKV